MVPSILGSVFSFSWDNALDAIIWLLIGACVYFVFDWGIKKMNPEQPFRKILDLILVVVVIFFCLLVLFTWLDIRLSIDAF